LPWQHESIKGKYKESEGGRGGPLQDRGREGEVIIVNASVAACTVNDVIAAAL